MQVDPLNNVFVVSIIILKITQIDVRSIRTTTFDQIHWHMYFNKFITKQLLFLNHKRSLFSQFWKTKLSKLCLSNILSSNLKDDLLGKTAQLWLHYKEKIYIFFGCLKATRENYMDLHIACLQEMCPLLPWIKIDNNYAKYLTIYFFHYQIRTTPILC